jgi:hypothetical protein
MTVELSPEARAAFTRRLLPRGEVLDRTVAILTAAHELRQAVRREDSDRLTRLERECPDLFEAIGELLVALHDPSDNPPLEPDSAPVVHLHDHRFVADAGGRCVVCHRPRHGYPTS